MPVSGYTCLDLNAQLQNAAGHVFFESLSAGYGSMQKSSVRVRNNQVRNL